MCAFPPELQAVYECVDCAAMKTVIEACASQGIYALVLKRKRIESQNAEIASRGVEKLHER